ncbi:MAG TPA: hypothetical protein VJ652_00895 [Noviherbaspirillum sp.]|nr:hypothetical protein [Noviherbaspirillum sp.]
MIVMKWYYEWRLNKVRAEISVLREATQARLQEDYTAYSRLRVLDRVAGSLQQRLAQYPSSSIDNAKEAH